LENFDNTFETFEEFEKRMALEGYYGDFSAQARKNLTAKNLPKVSNVYDVLYANTRKEMLAKNQNLIQSDLSENSELIRLNNIKSNIEKEIDLLDSSKVFRENNLGKNNLINTSNFLENVAVKKRDELLAKNDALKLNLDIYDDSAREQNLSKNAKINFDIDTYDDEARGRNLSNNTNVNVNIDTYDDNARGANLSSNVDSGLNIDTYDNAARNSNVSSNAPIQINIDTYDDNARASNVSSNAPIQINIDTYDDGARSSNLSSNAAIQINIDTYDDNARGANLSSNVPIGINIDTYDDDERAGELAANVPISVNIDTYDDNARGSNLSSNVPIQINIDTYDDDERAGELAANVPIGINIDTYDDAERASELSANVPISINIDTYDDNARGANLSNNVPIGINIDTYDDTERNNELAANVPIGINIDTYDDIERANELAANVPIGINIDTYDDAARVDNIANNVPIGINIDTYDDNARVDNIANNVPIGINIDTYDDNARVNNIVNNVPIGINIDTYDDVERNNEIASNVPININIDTYEGSARAGNIAHNIPSLFTIDTYDDSARAFNQVNNVPSFINIDTYDNVARIANISNNVPSFIGISTYAPAARLFQVVRNIPSPYSIDNFFNYFSNFQTSAQAYEFNVNNKNFFIGDPKKAYTLTSSYLDYVKGFVDPTNGQAIKIIPGENKSIASINVGYTSFYNSQSYLQQKADYTDKLIKLKTDVVDINELMRRYNLGRNYYTQYDSANNLSNTQNNLKEKQQVLDLVSKLENSSGWLQGVVDKNNEKTNDTPETTEAYIENNFYTQSVPNGQATIPSSGLKQSYSAGTAGSMMTNDISTDIISNSFLNGEQAINLKSDDSTNGQAKKGVRKIINTIANSDISFGKNFRKNQKSFNIGLNNDGTPKVAYKRYTFSDPSVNHLGNMPLVYFSIKNYSSETEILFPPYIKSYSDSAGADYVSHDFLGRPESVYTYSKSNRKGQISFIVLTDYAESVEIGSVVRNGNTTTLTERFDKNWTDSTTLKSGLPPVGEIEAEISRLKKEQAAIGEQILNLQKNSNSNNPDETATLEQLNSQSQELQSQLNDQAVNLSISTVNGKYFQEDKKTIKMNANELNIQTRLTAMKKELLFQPTYFSGSKVDFVNKMEFLMKLTRPAKNNSGSGFAFTLPPVSHINLGTWFNSDVIINSVSMDYADAPWTLDALRNNYKVQPMWATVTLDFTFIGSYGGGGTPVLSTDEGGFYSFKQGEDSNATVQIVQQEGQPASSTGGGGGGSGRGIYLNTNQVI